MNQLNRYYNKARGSTFYQWLFNKILWRTVPFNAPHKLRIISFGENELTIEAPYTKNNCNHIKGIHACLLATLSEYAIGLNLLLHISPKEYRIILKSIQMEYHYQAKTAVRIQWGISEAAIQQIKNELQTTAAVFKEFQAEIYDTEGNHISTGKVLWQIKAWSKVKTKVS